MRIEPIQQPQPTFGMNVQKTIIYDSFTNKRIIDTVSGAVTALDGRIEKVSNAIFVVAPYNYDIINEPINKEKSERTSFLGQK